MSCKDSIQFSQFFHLCRICLDDAIFQNSAVDMACFFHNWGFPPTVVDNHIQPITYASALAPSRHSQQRDQVPLILNFHPTCPRIQRTILHQIRQLWNATTKHIFPSHPRLHCAGIVPLGTPFTTNTKPPSHGTFPSNCRRCHTCPFTTSLLTIQGPKQSFQV
eukprot:g29429.t1